MQYKNATKIIIDKRKLDILIRLGCPDNQILEIIKTGKFTKTGDYLIDETLECLADFKKFKNWGGNHNPNGINGCNKSKKRGQVDIQVDKQDGGQVVDKDKDKDIDKDKIKNNRYGECKNVLLTEEQYKNLSELDNFDLALEKLDTWLGTSGSKNRNKNHYAYFKSNSWVWKDLKPKQTETEETVFIDEHTRIDETMPEFNDMTYDECCRAFEWLQEKMYCQSLSKSKFVEIVRKFKGIK